MNHDRTDRDTSETTGTTRRRLLRAATGGFALAASGLFLPEVIEDAAAREGALGGAKGGRHGNDHKGHHRHRDHGDKKDKGKDDHPPQHSGVTLDVALYVHTKRTALTIRVQQLNSDGTNPVLKWPTRTIPAGGFEDYRGSNKALLAEFVQTTGALTRYTVQVANGGVLFPHLWVWAGYKTVTDSNLVVDQGMDEWEKVYLDGYSVQRLNDTKDHKQFQIDEL